MNSLMQWLLAIVRLSLPIGLVAFAAFQFGTSAHGKLQVRQAVTAQLEESAHDPVAFAQQLLEERPARGAAGTFGHNLLEWLEQHPAPKTPAPITWRLHELLTQWLLSYFLCFAALGISGFLTFLLFQYLALPANPHRKTFLFLGLLLVTGLPAALLAWWPLAPLIERISWLPLVSRFTNQEAALSFLRAELTVLAAMVIGDGLAGMLMLRARALTSDALFEAQIATQWTSARLKNYFLPLPGTLSAAIGRAMGRRVLPSWSGLLGRYLVTEISLELVVRLLTDQKPQGIGLYTIRLLSKENASPDAFACAAGLLILPLALLALLEGRDETATPGPDLPRRAVRFRTRLWNVLKRVWAWLWRSLLRLLHVRDSYDWLRQHYGKFITLMNYFSLKPALSGASGWWRTLYVVGLFLFYFQVLLAFAPLVDRWVDLGRLLTTAGWFVLLSIVATLLVLILGTEISVWVGRLCSGRLRTLLQGFKVVARFPIVFWVLLLVPSLPEDPRLRMTWYWIVVLLLITLWSITEMASELVRHGDKDFVYFLRNLGVGKTKIYRTHILIGNCREYVVAHVFDLWIQLLLIELAMGFGVRFTETQTEYQNLATYGKSFGYFLASSLNAVHEAQSLELSSREGMLALSPALLLGLMFLSYWLIQVGILQLRQAGGLEYLKSRRQT